MDSKMAKKLTAVVVEIHWSYTTERVRLDLASLQSTPAQALDTFEYWPDENETLNFRPQATYRNLANGDHEIKLLYLKKEHKEWEGWDLLWGTSRIVVSEDYTDARAEWAGDPVNSKYDGEAESCILIPEQPSATKAQMGKVRVAQQIFKNSLLKFGGKCEISGETLAAVIDAAHIHDVQDGGADLPENGILLRADLHRLFDKGYFSIRNDGTISVHKKLPQAYARDLQGKSLSEATLRRIAPYLKRRRNRKPE